MNNADQPELEAAVRHTLGMTYWYLGRFEAANPHLEKAYELRLQVLGPNHPDTLTSLHDLAMQRCKQGKTREAVEKFRQAWAGRRRVLGTEHLDTLWSQLNLGMMLEDKELDEAETLLLEAIEACKRTVGHEHHHTLYGQHDLAIVLWNQGKLNESVELDSQTLAARRRSLGADHPDSLRSLDNLSGHLCILGKLEEAEALCREGLEGRRRVLGDGHEETFWSLHNLFDIRMCRDKLVEAEDLLREQLKMCQAQYGSDHEETQSARTALGLFLRQQGKRDQAAPLLQEVVRRSRQIVDAACLESGPEDPSTLTLQTELAWLLANQDSKEAEDLCRQTLKIQERVCGPKNKDTLFTRVTLTVLLSNQGKKTDAAALAREIWEGQPVQGADPSENPLAGTWRGTWKNSSGKVGPDSLSLTEQTDGTFRGIWSGYVRIRGTRLDSRTFVIQGGTSDRCYLGVGLVADGKILLCYSASGLKAKGIYGGWCDLEKSK